MFLEQFQFPDGQMVVAIRHPSNLTIYNGEQLPTDKNVFFGPALRTDTSGNKDSVVGTTAFWVDVDANELPRTTYPPSAAVRSGRGWHLYWMLDEPLKDIERIEEYNQILMHDTMGSDPGSWNANRVMRVPGTLNTKYDPPEEVVLEYINGIQYHVSDFDVLKILKRKTRHKIQTGDRRGFRSRSERDWSVICDLIAAGATDKLITSLFDKQAVGDKHRDANTSRKYLPHTLSKARTKVSEAQEEEWVENDEGYFVPTRSGLRRVSTYTLDPRVLLDGSVFDEEDAIVADVEAAGYTWKDITFPRSAFTSVRAMDKSCPVAAWQWLGRDSDVRHLLPYLMEQLQSKGLPRVAATPTLGFHVVNERPYFLGDKEVLGARSVWEEFDGPLAWLPTGREHPEMLLQPSVGPSDLELLADLVPKLNKPEVLWPMLGWYAASAAKPWLEEQGFRFPVLNVTGVRGSGKTTLIQRVMMPLFGQADPKSYDSGTTRFVKLSLLGSTNAIPIAFSEFRYESVEHFIRFVLLAYDTGHDPRGRSDQTTVDYPLTAPFSIDGEDLITDPAARERVVAVQLAGRTIVEGSESYNAYNTLRARIPPGFAGHYIQYMLGKIVDGSLKDDLEAAHSAMFAAFPGKLPDRIRNNYTVAMFGARVWCDVVGIEHPDANVVRESMDLVYSVEAGRGRLLVDDFIEDVINAVVRSTSTFQWKFDSNENTLYFQLSPAHAWWLVSRRRQGRGTLERNAIQAQLKEVDYCREPKAVDNTWMYGVHLTEARTAGLDVPTHLETMEVRF